MLGNALVITIAEDDFLSISSQHTGEKTELAREVFDMEPFAAFHVDHNEYFKNNCSSVLGWVNLGWRSNEIVGLK